MYKVKVLPDDIEVWCDEDETILEASLRSGIPHMNACGGLAKCSTCRIHIIEGSEACINRNALEELLAQRLKFDTSIRLACQLKVQGNLIIKRPVIDELDKQIILNEYEGKFSVQPVGNLQPIAVMFTDLEGYTAFAENNLPFDVVHVLNRYFHLVGAEVEKRNGKIIDYYGDGILTAYGIGSSGGSNPVLDAVTAGLRIQVIVNELNTYLSYLFGEKMKVRSGIDFGMVVVGTIGYFGATKFAVIGDVVNRASRIENKNKKLKTKLLLSKSAYDEIPDLLMAKKKIKVRLRGTKGKHTLYEVESLKQAT